MATLLPGETLDDFAKRITEAAATRLRLEMSQMQGQFTKAMDSKDKEIIRLRGSQSPSVNRAASHSKNGSDAELLIGNSLSARFSAPTAQSFNGYATASDLTDQSPATGPLPTSSTLPPSPVGSSLVRVVPIRSSIHRSGLPSSTQPAELPKSPTAGLGSNPSERAEKTSGGTEEPAKGEAFRPAAHVYRMMRAEAPKDSRGYQAAARACIRMLWMLYDNSQAPNAPSDDVVNRFYTRFPSSQAVQRYNKGQDDIYSIASETVAMGSHYRLQGARNAKSLIYVDHVVIKYLQMLVARYGLERFSPKLDENAYSAYNSAHRLTFLAAFEQAARAHAFADLSPDLDYLANIKFTVKIYDHFVHHYLFSIFERERLQPGSTAKAFAQQSVYQNRHRLKLRRLKYMKDHGFPKRKLDMCVTKAMSSDERLPDGTFEVHDMPLRSDEMYIMMEGVDKAIQEEHALIGRRDQFRVRKRVVNPKPSPYKAQPLGIGIQYYEAKQFNRLSRPLKQKLAEHKVTFPSDTLEHASTHDSDRMSDQEFERVYGQALEIYDYYAPDADNEDEDEDGDEEMLGNGDLDMAEKDVAETDVSDEEGQHMAVDS